MKHLLDTHAIIWWMDQDQLLGPAAHAAISDRKNDLLISAASIWEIAIKVGLGKLTLPGEPEAVVPEMMERSRVTPLPILPTHALRVASLPPHHRDPFDRMLVAQAQLERVPVLTADGTFLMYDVDVLEP